MESASNSSGGSQTADEADAKSAASIDGSSSGLTPSVAVLMIAGMTAFGSATPVSRVVGRSFPVWLGSMSRMIVCVAVLSPIVWVYRRRHDERPLRRTVAEMSGVDLGRLAAIGLIGTFAFTAFMLLGMREAPGAVGAVVMATTPAVTATASVLFLGDRITRWKVLALALAVAGVVVVNVAGLGDDSEGDLVVVGSLLVFAAVCCEATYTLVGKRLSTDLDAMSLTLLAAIVAIIGFAPLAIWDLVKFDWTAPSITEWIAVLWWGAATMALGSVLWFNGVREVSGTTASVFMGVMPVSALILSYVILDEAFRWIHVVGMAMVLGGLALTTWRSRTE